MARIQKKRIRWTPGDQAVSHRVYISQEEPTYGSPQSEVKMPKTEIILPDEWPGTLLEGDYYVGISSLDDLGNETDIVVVTTPFDFVPPGLPSDIVIEDA